MLFKKDYEENNGTIDFPAFKNPVYTEDENVNNFLDPWMSNNKLPA